jgi:starvation-inducible DNA-binding protein
MAADDKDLASTVQDILNKTFCLYMTASKYHWNVKGTDFPQYHEFFGEIYEDAQGAIDHLAEMILMLGGTADLNPDKVGKSVTPSDMIRDLLKKSEALIEDLTKAVDEATEAEEHAVANDLAERLGAHQKWAWQLKSTK